MGKYDQLKKLKLTKAREDHVCHKCGGKISKGTEYYKEDLGKIMKPPSMVLRSFCTQCHSSFGETLLHK